MGEGGARNAPEKQDIQFIEHFLAGKGGRRTGVQVLGVANRRCQ